MTTKRRCRVGSIAWLRELYAELNKDFFGRKLPRNLKIEWCTLPGTVIARVRWRRYTSSKRGKDLSSGAINLIVDDRYVPYVMQFSPRLKHRALQKQVGMSMLHEMVHLKLGVKVACEEWDGEFDKEMFQLAAAGAFRLFW